MILTAEDIAKGTGGELVRGGSAGEVTTDSRALKAGEWFVALKGDRFDAHDFLADVERRGCAGVIATRVPEGFAAGFVRVSDPLAALQALASFARSSFDGPVVGITGSAGKTTTRAMVAQVLGALGPVHQTQGNLNNHIGVPLTILRAPLEARSWVIEMGMNHLGEIAVLQAIARPTVRLITNVGAAHIEGCGSIEGVAQAKGELFDGARVGDICCVNMDDARVAARPIPAGVRVVRYGSSQDCDVRWTDAKVDVDSLETRVHIETHEGSVLARIKSPGLHLASNVCAAVMVGVVLHVPVAEMAPRLLNYEPVGMRLRVEPGPRGIRVLNDAYNANPLSMRASLDMVASLEGVRRVALLGDMLELGSEEASAHAEILAHARGLGLDLLGLAGPRFAAALGHDAGSHLVARPDALELGLAVRASLRPGDVVLVKGSRGMAMERVLQSLVEE